MNRRLLITAAALFAPAVLMAQNNIDREAHQRGLPAGQPAWMPGPGATLIHSDQRSGQTGPVAGRPVSADEVRTAVQTLADGSHITSSETNHFYRDSQGRMRIETETGVMIYDPIAGVTYDLTKGNKTYEKHTQSKDSTVTIAAAAHYSSISSTSGTPSAGHRESRSGASEGVIEDIPAQSINGLWVKGSRVTVTIPSGAVGNDRDLKVVNERWVSDDLKLLIKTSNSDPRFGTTTYELTNLVQKDPDPSLFVIPEGYVEGDRHAPAPKHE
jgi:hypothetical protein